jgi:hypothetical protein
MVFGFLSGEKNLSHLITLKGMMRSEKFSPRSHENLSEKTDEKILQVSS